MNRPYNNFRTTITDDDFFVGRSQQLDHMLADPCRVHILLGGRRLGKSSTLRAVERRLLAGDDVPKKVFPVFIDLQLDQPESVNNFRYRLMLRFRQAWQRWDAVKTSELRDLYRSFLAQISYAEITLAGFIRFRISNPDEQCELGHDDFRAALAKGIKDAQQAGFEGICFILDEAEFIVTTDWANNAWSYIRGLMDSDMAVKPFLGFMLAGYRQVCDYEQRVGSPLRNIARVQWLDAMAEKEARELIARRVAFEEHELSEAEIIDLIALSGGQPYLLQQLLNLQFDARATTGGSETELEVAALRTTELTSTFRDWWEELGERERRVYCALGQHGPSSDEALAGVLDYPLGTVQDALAILAGRGIVPHHGGNSYSVGSRLFQTWVDDRRD